MPTDVIMPQMGESIFEGTIVKWLKKAGDSVHKDEALFEISTDKVDAEIPSPVAGTLTEIKVPEGATVEINTVVAVVAESDEEQGSGTKGLGTQGMVDGAEASGSTDVIMPQLGESIFEGTIVKWFKKAGDRVGKDEPLFEISTDKVDAEIPSPAAGVLTEIKAPEGATVGINTVVAVIGGGQPQVAAPAVKTDPHSQAFAPPASASTSVPAAAAASPNGQRIRSSPLVRRIAKENHLDLGRIAGTGSDGRITKEDVLRHISEHGPGSIAPKSSAPAASALADQLVPLGKMRSIIAQRMVESVATSPHAYTVYKMDMTRVVRIRERERAKFEEKNGVKLTYMPFIAAAAVEALRTFPIVNASLENGSIHYHGHINLGIAVALESGLIVPVVREAESLGFLGLARAIAGLAERARTKKLKPDEASGSTFTLTNSGVFGGEFGTPIINQPESAILAFGGLKKEAVVLTDTEGNDTIAIRSMQYYCLGFDHRTFDGADAGRFMLELKKTLEGWDREIG